MWDFIQNCVCICNIASPVFCKKWNWQSFLLESHLNITWRAVCFSLLETERFFDVIWDSIKHEPTSHVRQESCGCMSCIHKMLVWWDAGSCFISKTLQQNIIKYITKLSTQNATVLALWMCAHVDDVNMTLWVFWGLFLAFGSASSFWCILLSVYFLNFLVYNSERFEPRWVNVVVWMIVRVCSVVLRRTVVGVDWRFDNLSGSHHQSKRL